MRLCPPYMRPNHDLVGWAWLFVPTTTWNGLAPARTSAILALVEPVERGLHLDPTIR
jgi:hypothetical protein